MGMGSAYAAGAGMIQKQDSYVPLMRGYTDMAKVRMPELQGMSRRPSTRSSGRTDYYALSKQKTAEKKRQDAIDSENRARRNQYMAAHHGREPTPEEMAEMQIGVHRFSYLPLIFPTRVLSSARTAENTVLTLFSLTF